MLNTLKNIKTVGVIRHTFPKCILEKSTEIVTLMDYVGTKEAMLILGIKSTTTIMKYENEGKIRVYRPFSNRKRYKVSELLKLQSKG